MTDERRQDVLLIALVVSVVAHVGLMFFIKPQVMTHVSGGASRTRDRGPMTVKEAPPPAEVVKMEVVRDVEAVRESPVAAAEDLMPAVSSVAVPDVAPTVATPDLTPDASVMPKPEIEIAPYLSEKIHVESGVSSVTTPVVDGDALMSSVPKTVTTAPETRDVVESVDDIPMFTAPAFVPTVQDEGLAVAPESPAEGEGQEEKKSSYTPSEEVLATVDEKIVESEKAAVRDLLDVRNAQELERFVNVVATSATAGDWTYFRVQLNPRTSLQTVPKDVVVLLDASGSIGDDRLKSCRSAARTILRTCTNTGDRFNLVAFRDRFSYAFKSWQSCSKEGFERADKWLNSLAAHGRTDVFSVIRSVLTLPRDPTRPLIALVVTDGDANTGVSETADILSKFTALNDGLISVYMYGVKGSANKELIDVLTRGNRGESFIYGGYRWKAGSAIESLSERFRDPVLSDLRVVFTSSSQAEIYPRRLRNLYRGEVVDLVGRVPKGQTQVSFSVKGLNGAKPYEGFFRVDLSVSGFDETLPTSWSEEAEIDRKLR